MLLAGVTLRRLDVFLFRKIHRTSLVGADARIFPPVFSILRPARLFPFDRKSSQIDSCWSQFSSLERKIGPPTILLRRKSHQSPPTNPQVLVSFKASHRASIRPSRCKRHQKASSRSSCRIRPHPRSRLSSSSLFITRRSISFGCLPFYPARSSLRSAPLKGQFLHRPHHPVPDLAQLHLCCMVTLPSCSTPMLVNHRKSPQRSRLGGEGNPC